MAQVGLGSGVILLTLYVLSQVLSAIKWRILLRESGIERTRTEVIRAYFAGMFVNSFGLGTVGGDVTRAVALKPQAGQRAAVLASVAADRVHGLTVLLAIGVIGAAFSQNFVGRHEARLFGPLVVTLVMLGWWFAPRLIRRYCSGVGLAQGLLRRVADAFPTRLNVMVSTTSVSAAVHLLQIAMQVLIAHSLGIRLPLALFVAIIPMVNVASSLPISIQGVGVREGMYLMLLTPLGVSSEHAVALAVIWAIVVTLVSLVSGALLGLLGGKRVRSDLNLSMKSST